MLCLVLIGMDTFHGIGLGKVRLNMRRKALLN